MQIQTLATGSSGNAYIISDGSSKLLLECGVTIQRLKQGSGFGLSRIAGCLVTHEHQDHAKAARDILAQGLPPLYMSQGTAAACGLKLPGRQIMKAGQQTSIGTFTVLPFTVVHDAAEPLGWLIQSNATTQRLVFATDTRLLDYTFPHLNHIMVECNHLGLDSMGETNFFLARRVVENHMSLEECLRFIKRQDLTSVTDITLLHLSSVHGDPVTMQKAVAAATGCRVVIASPKRKELSHD